VPARKARHAESHYLYLERVAIIHGYAVDLKGKIQNTIFHHDSVCADVPYRIHPIAPWIRYSSCPLYHALTRTRSILFPMLQMHG
jgi:hypothetical protein